MRTYKHPIFLSENAVTLTEILVASVIVAIISLGIVSVDIALRQSERGTTRNTLVAARTSAMMLHITKNVELMTGDDDDRGWRITTGATTLFRIRKEAGVPGNYADDTWVCYHHNNSTLRFCQIGTTSQTCDNTSQPATVETLGQLYRLNPSVVIDSSEGAQDFYVLIELINCYEPWSCNPSNPDHLDNPVITLRSRISPLSSSATLP